MNLIPITLVYFSYTLHISSGLPVLDTHVQPQPLAPISLSPGNVNLETYWAEKYRTTGEGGDNLPVVPVQQQTSPQNSPSALPTIENNNDGNSEDAVGEVLSRQQRSPQHHHHHHHHEQPVHYPSHSSGHGHYNPHHYNPHHNPHHHG